MKKLLMQILGWFDNKVKENEYQAKNFPANEIDWPRVIPYLGLHLGLISLFYVGYSFADCGHSTNSDGGRRRP